jgi:hypothetical protein
MLLLVASDTSTLGMLEAQWKVTCRPVEGHNRGQWAHVSGQHKQHTVWHFHLCYRWSVVLSRG